MSPLFNAVDASGIRSLKPLRVQRYNNFLEYANILRKKMQIFMYWQKKRHDEMT